MMKPTITLSPLDREYARAMAAYRTENRIQHTIPQKSPKLDAISPFHVSDQNSSYSEVAVQVYREARRPRVDSNDDLPDVEPNIEVRWCRHPYGHPKCELPVKDRDHSDRVFVLVTGIPPRYTIHGWIQKPEVEEHPEWRKNPYGAGEAWFVPVDALHQIQIRSPEGVEIEWHDDSLSTIPRQATS